MDKLEKILELLEKKHLTVEERKFISDAELYDPEVKELLSLHSNLEKSFEHKLHQDPDLIADVVLFENGEDPSDSSVKHIYSQIKTHIESCETCKEEYNSYLEEYRTAAKHTSELVSEVKSEKERQVESSRIFSAMNFSRVKYAAASLLIIIISYAGLYLYSSLNVPEYKKSVLTEDSSELFITRGRTSVLFQKSIDAINKNEIDKAIEYLKQDIKENSNDRTIFYSYYILGVLQIEDSEESFIGLFKNYNDEKVYEAISSLTKAISLNNSGDYFNITLEIHYNLGRAHLLTDDFNSAEDHFSIVIENKGKYYRESEQMLKLMREYEK